MVTPTISILVNGAPCDVIFDTGSSGLKLLSGGIKGTAVDTDKEYLIAGYGFSPPIFYIKGPVAGADLQIALIARTTPWLSLWTYKAPAQPKPAPGAPHWILRR